MSFLINDAWADTAKVATTSSTSTAQSLMSMAPMIILLVLFMYLMVIRPQSKKAKEHKNLLNSLQIEDEVVTVGGVLGKIIKVADDFIVIKIADNTQISIQKWAVANVVPRGTMKTMQ